MIRNTDLNKLFSVIVFRCILQDQNGTAIPSWSCSKAVYKLVWHISLLILQWINSWWWTDELSEPCRVSCQNKFVKLVHLVGFIKKKFSQIYIINWRLPKVSRQNGKISWIIERSWKREFDIQIEVKKLRWGVGLNWSGWGQEQVEEPCIDGNEILGPLIWNISLRGRTLV